MKNIGIALGAFFFFSIVGMISSQDGKSNGGPGIANASADALDIAQMKESIIKEDGGMKRRWKKVEFEQNAPSEINFYITYRAGLNDFSLPRKEAIHLARTTLRRLVKDGHKNEDEMILVNVTMMLDVGKGETGEPLSQNLGAARYNPNSDQITFEYPSG